MGLPASPEHRQAQEEDELHHKQHASPEPMNSQHSPLDHNNSVSFAANALGYEPAAGLWCCHTWCGACFPRRVPSDQGRIRSSTGPAGRSPAATDDKQESFAWTRSETLISRTRNDPTLDPSFGPSTCTTFVSASVSKPQTE